MYIKKICYIFAVQFFIMNIETINQKYFDLTKKELELETNKKKPNPKKIEKIRSEYQKFFDKYDFDEVFKELLKNVTNE